MTVREFIEITTKEKNKKMNAILETKKYLPIAEKRLIAERVIDACTENNNGIITVDSVTKYIIFTITVINKYTNLEIGVDGNALDDYDVLCEAGLLNAVIETFAAEYEKTNSILNMMLGDLMQSNSVEAAVMGVMSKIDSGLGDIIDTLANKIDEINLDLGNMDPAMIDKVMKLLGTTKSN